MNPNKKQKMESSARHVWIKYENFYPMQVKLSEECESVQDLVALIVNDAVLLKQLGVGFLQGTLRICQSDGTEIGQDTLLASLSGAGGQRTCALNLKVDASELPVVEVQQKHLDGIDVNQPFFKRTELVHRLHTLCLTNRFVLMSSPAASGKTSLIDMYIAQLRGKPYKTSYISCMDTPRKSLSELLMKVGVDLKTQQYHPPNENDSLHIIIIDDAQERYDPQSQQEWTSLIKTSAIYYPKCKFIISAVHSLTMNGYSPAAFDALPRLPCNQLLLSREESQLFLESDSFGLSPKIRMHKDLVALIVKQCGGLIGSLRISAQALNCHFIKVAEPKLSETMRYFLSTSVLPQFSRCFGGSLSKPIKPEFIDYLQTALLHCIDLNPNAREEPEVDMLMHFVKSGVLRCDDVTNIVEFASPMAQRYFFAKCFPNRGRVMPDSLDSLVENAICNLPWQILTSSTPGELFPKEAVFQHLMSYSLAQCTPPQVSVYPELSQSFVIDEPIAGEIDFFLDDVLGWGIELLIQGRRISDHMERFESGGKYAFLNASDYRVVDFRQTDDGKVTNVIRHEKRITAFFKKGDFSQCMLVIGMHNPREVHLRR